MLNQPVSRRLFSSTLLTAPWAATNYVRQGRNEALAGKPVSVATSRAYGGSIKYKT